jgi:hypothetical protein
MTASVAVYRDESVRVLSREAPITVALGNQGPTGPAGPAGPAGEDGEGTGDVVGPESSVAGNFPTFTDTSGKAIQDSGVKIDTDAGLVANSDTRIPSQKAVKAYADGLLDAVNGWQIKNVALDCSTNPNYPAASAGHAYVVSVAGKIGGASGKSVEVGDIALCLVDASAEGDEATVGDNWTILQANLVGAVAQTRQVLAGTGMSGGGDLSADRTLSVDNASDANIRAAAGNKVVTSDLIESASALVALTDAAPVAIDWDTGVNFSLTVTTDRQIGNPTNGQPGTWRTILVQGDDATDRVITFGDQFLGDVPTITTCDSGKWYLISIFCVTTTHFVASAVVAKS